MNRLVTRFVAILTILGLLIITINVNAIETLQCYPFATTIHGTDGTEKQYSIDASCNVNKNPQ